MPLACPLSAPHVWEHEQWQDQHQKSARQRLPHICTETYVGSPLCATPAPGMPGLTPPPSAPGRHGLTPALRWDRAASACSGAHGYSRVLTRTAGRPRGRTEARGRRRVRLAGPCGAHAVPTRYSRVREGAPRARPAAELTGLWLQPEIRAFFAPARIAKCHVRVLNFIFADRSGSVFC